MKKGTLLAVLGAAGVCGAVFSGFATEVSAAPASLRLAGTYLIGGGGTASMYDDGGTTVGDHVSVTGSLDADGFGHASITLYSDASDGLGIVGWVTSKTCTYTEGEMGPQTGTFSCEFETPSQLPVLYGKYVVGASGQKATVAGVLLVRKKVVGGWTLKNQALVTLELEQMRL